MQVKDMRKLLKGLKGNMKLELHVSYDCNNAAVGCYSLEIGRVQTIDKSGKKQMKAVLYGEDGM